MLKAIFCVLHKVGEYGQIVPTLLSSYKFMLQSSFFEKIMLHDFEVVSSKENDLNPLTKLWCKVFSFPILNHKLLEYIKLVEIAIVQVLSLDENNQTFNILSFMKNKL
jgi:hypothetical protein